MSQLYNSQKYSLVLVTLLSCSCSLFDGARKTLSSDTPDRNYKNKKVKWVSKVQYDDLLSKYKNLVEENEKLKEQNLLKGQSPDLSQALAEPSKTTNQSAPVITDTTDIYTEALESTPTSANKNNEHMQLYSKATKLMNSNQKDEALKVFQYLASSANKQIKVRSKVKVANIYFEKGNFDLSLQSYQSVLDNDAFSAQVIVSLNGALRASQKLGLDDKEKMYRSILEDIFEQGT